MSALHCRSLVEQGSGWQKLLIFCYMDLERKSILEYSYNADFQSYSIGGIVSYILSRAPGLQVSVVARSNYDVVKEHVHLL